MNCPDMLWGVITVGRVFRDACSDQLKPRTLMIYGGVGRNWGT